MAADARQTDAAIGIAAGAAMIFAAFLPWAKVTAPLVGTFSKSLMDGGDGIALIIAGGVIAATSFSVLQGSANRRAVLIIAIAALAAGALIVFELSDTQNRFNDVSDASDLIATSYGAGAWLSGASAIAAFVASMRLRSSLQAGAPGVVLAAPSVSQTPAVSTAQFCPFCREPWAAALDGTCHECGRDPSSGLRTSR